MLPHHGDKKGGGGPGGGPRAATSEPQGTSPHRVPASCDPIVHMSSELTSTGAVAPGGQYCMTEAVPPHVCADASP